MTAGRGPAGEHLHSHPGLAQSYRPPALAALLIEFGSRFDQRREGVQPGVATVKFAPLRATSPSRFTIPPRR